MKYLIYGLTGLIFSPFWIPIAIIFYLGKLLEKIGLNIKSDIVKKIKKDE